MLTRMISGAHERSRSPYHQPSPIPAVYAWPALQAKGGDSLLDHYRHTLEELGRQEIVDDLKAALEQFRLIAGDLAAEATQE